MTRRDWWILGGLTLAALVFRFVSLGHPGEIIFDETYFAVFAQNYLTATPFFDAEPPLGKFLIAGGEWLFGNDSFGWRFAPALFGAAVIPLLYLLAKRIFGGVLVPAFAGILALLDGFLLVESRTAVLDGFVVFFNVLTYFLFFSSLQAKTRRAAYRWLAVTGVAFGLGLSLKWITLAFIAPAVGLLLVYAFRDRRRVRRLFKVRSGDRLLAALGVRKENLFRAEHYVAWLVVVPVIIYTAIFAIHVPFDSTGENAAGIHKQIWNYHHNLDATHPYGSDWYTWPAMIRPVAYYFKVVEGQWQGIIAMGNPVVWWGGLLAVIFAAVQLIRRRSLALAFVLFAVLAHYAPWAVIDRVLFIYHYAGALPFVILALAYALGQSWQWRPKDPWPQSLVWLGLMAANGVLGGLLLRSAFGGDVVWFTVGTLLAGGATLTWALTNRPRWRWGRKQSLAFLVLALLAFVYFYPVWTGVGLDVTDYARRMWLKSWI
ncbi:MAG: phospholipid carrier-dependent glycosyltransferase [bacterium]|nr:phospholipid carrier-dependent glycosyltransferase [bacterium]